jgi:hypothetical protein
MVLLVNTVLILLNLPFAIDKKNKVRWANIFVIGWIAGLTFCYYLGK